jgi:hypothetical protein
MYKRVVNSLAGPMTISHGDDSQRFTRAITMFCVPKGKALSLISRGTTIEIVI